MKLIISLLAMLGLLAVGAAAFFWFGGYSIAADDAHWPVTARAMEAFRDSSIAARTSDIVVPDLEAEALIRAGAGNYDAMCAGCHLRPGVEQSELSAGLYPAPPDFVRQPRVDAARAFWVIKHGIKMSGMPAWGKSMDDESIWGMVAFLRQLPGMPENRYRELAEASGGHAHGPAESAATHVHDDGSTHEHKN